MERKGLMQTGMEGGLALQNNSNDEESFMAMVMKSREDIFSGIPEFRMIFDSIRLVLDKEHKESGKEYSDVYSDGKTIYINTRFMTHDHEGVMLSRLIHKLLHTYCHLYLQHPFKTQGKKRKTYDKEADREVRSFLGKIGIKDDERYADTHDLWYLESQESNSGSSKGDSADGDNNEGNNGDSADEKSNEGNNGNHNGNSNVEYNENNNAEGKLADTGKSGGKKNNSVKEKIDCMKLWGFGKMPGNEYGGRGLAITPAKRKSNVEYEELLRDCVRMHEKECLKDEEFDYAWYEYGHMLYDDIAIIEPPETIEAKRIDDLAIAIDVSGSCDGGLSEQFLKETFAILDTVVNEGQELSVKVFLVDNEVRKEFLITCPEDIPSDKEFRFYGGGTDFTGLFGRIEELVENGELAQPKTLILFSDGYGEFGNRRPDYKVYCVGPGDRTDYMPEWVENVKLSFK